MAAKDNVIIRMSAEDAGAFEEWRKQARGPEQFGQAVEKAADKGKSAAAGLAVELVKMAGTWVTIASLVKAATDAVNEHFETKRRLEQESAGANASADAAVRGYFVRAKISDPAEQKKSLERIGNIAIKQKEKLSTAGAGARLLTGFGVSREEAEGGTLDELLNFYDAMSGTGTDPSESAERVLRILDRSGAGVNRKSLRKLGATARGLMTSAKGFGSETMDQYAAVSSFAKDAGMDQSAGLAMFTALMEKYEGKQAKTFFKEMAKPGMQSGEKDIRARASALLAAGGGEKDYQLSADIADQGIQAEIDTSQTAGILGGAGDKKLTTEQIRERLKFILKQQGAGEDLTTFALNQYDHPWGPDSWWNDKDRAEMALAAVIPNRGLSRADEAAGNRFRAPLVEQAIGNQPLTVRLKTDRGQDLPHTVEATGIQGR